jgi:hypothetical protein
MISPEEKAYILNHAYVPEHLVDLITQVSGGEAYLIEDYLCLRGRDWSIIVGYPLAAAFLPEALQTMAARVLERFRPREAWIIAPSLPSAMLASCVERESDHYYTLDLGGEIPEGRLIRVVEKARQNLTVERGAALTLAHQELMREFMGRVELHPRVQKLLLAMPAYVSNARTAWVLNALDKKGNLAAFSIIDLAAKNFSTYVIGCYSRKNYVPWASDLLFYEMVKLSQEHDKSYIHLGLGVNAGIRRFKEKWHGLPTIKYEMCQLVLRQPSLFESLMAKQ